MTIVLSARERKRRNQSFHFDFHLRLRKRVSDRLQSNAMQMPPRSVERSGNVQVFLGQCCFKHAAVISADRVWVIPAKSDRKQKTSVVEVRVGTNIKH